MIAPTHPELAGLSIPAALLDAVGTGIIHFSPVYATNDPATLVDLAYVRLNPTAQRLFGLPEFPTETLLALAPQQAAIFAFCCDAFWAAAAMYYEPRYYSPSEGGSSWAVAAQRHQDQLVVSFHKVAEGVPASSPPALPDSSLAKQNQALHAANEELRTCNSELGARMRARTRDARAARAAAEAQRQQLAAIIRQAPVAISYLEGPELRIITINATACAVWGRAQEELLGQPLLEALPQLQGQGFEEMLTEVMRTQTPLRGTEFEVPLLRNGQLITGYFNVVYQPLLNEQEGTSGILTVAVEVTEQVLARRQQQQLNDVLELRVAAQVAESERQRQRLTRFFQQVPAAICILDGPEQVFELVNPAYQQRFPGRQLLGRPLREALPELEAQGIPALLSQVYQTGITHEGHKVLLPLARPGDGQVEMAYLNCVYQARYDEEGRIDGVLVFALDVTAQVQAQQRAEELQQEVLATAQRRAKEREAFYQIFSQTPAVIALMRGPEYRFEYVNQAFEALFPGRTFLHRPLTEVLPETGPQGFIALMDHVYQTGESYIGTEVPLQIAQANGPPTERRLNFVYQAYRENEAIVGISVFAYDVTEQVLARRQREAQQQQLRELFEQAPVAMGIFAGPDYVVEICNPGLQEIWGRTAEQVINQPLFEALPEIRSQGFKELLDKVVRTGEPHVAHEVPLQVHHGGELTTVYVNFVYHPLRDEQGSLRAVAAVATDVSEQVRARRRVVAANQALTLSNVQLTRTNADLDNFIYTASHDLKAPIANIEGLLLLLRKQLPLEARQAGLVPRVLDMMQGAIERFQLTIVQLTDLSRLQQAGAGPLETVDLAAVVEAVRLDLLPILEATGAQLHVEVAADTSVLFAPQHLRSVIYNLLSNALKYQHPDRVPQVQLRCQRKAGRLLLEVQDNGLGLTEEQQAKLFGLFRRLHAHVEGSGVGLYMVKRIVENAGGTITVQSQPKLGSTFVVSLPA